jgi:hypothetical protein
MGTAHKPTALTLKLDGIPQELRALPRWVGWEYRYRKGDWTKVPINLMTNAEAKTNDPSTWATFTEAERALSNFDGIGFVFDGSEYVGIDLDDCRDPETGELTPFAKRMLERFPTYTEISPSGTGIKLFARGKLNDKGRRSKAGADKIEVYVKGRYFAVTGRPVDGAPLEIVDCQGELDRLHSEVFPPRKPSAQANGNAHVALGLTSDRSSVIERARKYVAKMKGAVSGQRGHDCTYHVACSLVLGFGLTPDEAFPVISEWNASCQPPWSERELRHKLEDADKEPDERGTLLRTNGVKGLSADRVTNEFRRGPGPITNGHSSKKGVEPVPMAQIVESIRGNTGDWPRRVGSMLFVHEPGAALDFLDNPAAVFGYIGTKTGQPAVFHNATGAHTKPEVFAELRRTVRNYESVETLPHEPQITGAYYACDFPPAGNGDALRALVNRFCPATPIDADLILAFFVTLFWGGRGGARPLFALTSKFGRGTGKTTVVSVAARLAGGGIELAMREDAEVVKQRLLSQEGITKRLACIDNAKGSGISSADLEAFVTIPTISGKRMYVGEASRPNTLVWAMTINGVSLGTDLAQRAVIIELDKPKHSATWAEETYQFVDDKRQELIGDILGFLRRERAQLPASSRWGAWENDVLSRLPEPADAQRVILERQASSDAEQEEADVVEEHFESQLLGCQYSTDSQRVFLPSTVARDWLNQATNERHTTTSASRWLKQQISERKLRRLAESKGRAHGRGFLWVGQQASDSAIANDLEARLSARDRRP